MTHTGQRDVVVVGGGIIGLSIAWRAATAGLSVTVVDPEGEAAHAFEAIAERIDVELAPTRRFNKELKLL